MNTKVTYVLILLSVVVFGWLILRVPAGYKQRENDLKARHAYQMDSVVSLRIKSDSIGYAAFKACQEASNRMEGDRNYWKNKAKKCEQ